MVHQFGTLRDQNFGQRAPGYALIVNYAVGQDNSALQKAVTDLYTDTAKALSQHWDNMAQIRSGCNALASDLGRFVQEGQANDLHFRRYLHELHTSVDGLVAGQKSIVEEGFKQLREGADATVRGLSERTAQAFEDHRKSWEAWVKKLAAIDAKHADYDRDFV